MQEGRTPDGFPQLQAERDIAEEMANTLGRIGREFVRRREDAWRAFEAVRECPPEAEERRAALEKGFQAALDQAERYRYFLIVQREAMGLRDHAEVARKFPLPEVPGRLPAPGDPASPRLAWPGGFSRALRRKSAGG
jgi:hypothetical protein